MKRTFLVAAVAVAPLLVAAGGAWAQVQITTSTTTPIATATANAGAPADIVITSSGSVNPTAPGVAVKLNSNNKVSNAGAITFNNVNGAVGIQAQGGNTGQVTNTGSINITESYMATDSNNDGLLDGVFAQGMNRTGIQVVGTAPFVGGVTSTGVITIKGDNSQGISIQAPITGDLLMLTVTPAATTGGTPTVANGSITVVGSNVNPGDSTVGLQVTPTGSVGGNVKISSVSATGVGAQGVVIGGPVAGGIDISGSVIATGYRSTTRSTIPALATLYTAGELQQGGTAVSIAANVGKGLIVSAPPLTLSTTNPDLDGNGVPDASQGTGHVTSFGKAAALQIGAATSNVQLGLVGTGANAYGLVIQGTVIGNGVFDPLTTPNLGAPVSATAIQVGVAGSTGATVILGGIHNTGGVTAQAYQADATAIHFGNGAATPTIVNDGAVLATSTQVNTATTGIAPVTVDAILIDKGASVASLVNNAGITANITGTGGVGGNVGAIVDKSGSLASIINTGSINAQLIQTLVAVPLPGSMTAIDISNSVAAQTITQQASAAQIAAKPYVSTSTYATGAIVSENGILYEATAAAAVAADPASNPAIWRQIGATAPSINGSILFGGGGANLNVSAGTVASPLIQLGAGVNTVTVSGKAGTGVTGASVTGSLQEGAANSGGNGGLTITVDNGTLSDTNPNTIKALSVNVGANGLLLVSADPTAGTNTRFITTGASTFAPGAQVGLTLRSIQVPLMQTYTILSTVPGQGTLTAGAFGTSVLTNAPFLYTANASYAPAANPTTGSSEILLTVARKTTAQLGFNAAEASALEPVLAAAPNDLGIQSALLAQTTQAGFKSVYDQLLPSQGQGLFDALDSAVQAIAGMTGVTPDAGTRVAGSSLWLQEVNERVRRSGIDSGASYAKLLGVVGGAERMAPAGGAIGATLAYFNANETDAASQVGGGVVASMVEGGAYYRRAVGGLTISARGAAGYSWFSGERRFLAAGASNIATASWSGLFFDGHFGAAYERRFGRYYARPELSVDFLRLKEDAHNEVGGGNGFDLNLSGRTSSRLSGQAIMVLGTQWGSASWLRTEIRGGFREIFSGNVGDTVANFDGGAPFSLSPDQDKGGWATVGFSIKGGSQSSYLALEGDADFRSGEQRYDLRIAGRSMF